MEGRLNAEEVVQIVFGVLVAGHETTANMLGKGLVALLDHPDQFAAVRADPSLVPSVIDEVLRYVVLSPTTDPQEGLHLVTTTEVELGGFTIPAQSVILASPTAANLDPRAFPEPDRFDLGRANADDHVAFGHGPHRCLGAQLARLELEVAYTALLREFPGCAWPYRSTSSPTRAGCCSRDCGRCPSPGTSEACPTRPEPECPT